MRGIPEVKVLGYITNEEELGSFWDLTVGDVVIVEPILEYTGDSTALALKFEWIAENGTTDEVKTIGFGKQLVWETDMGGFIRVSLFITDTLTGYQIIHEELAMWPTNSESTSEAWMVLSEVDGKACFSILEDASNWEGTNYVYRFMRDGGLLSDTERRTGTGRSSGQDYESLAGGRSSSAPVCYSFFKTGVLVRSTWGIRIIVGLWT